jgi:hypothetical protein
MAGGVVVEAIDAQVDRSEQRSGVAGQVQGTVTDGVGLDFLDVGACQVGEIIRGAYVGRSDFQGQRPAVQTDCEFGEVRG